MLKTPAKALVASVGLAGLLYFGCANLVWLEMGELDRIIWMAGVCIVGFSFYVGVLYVLGWRFEQLNHYSSERGG